MKIDYDDCDPTDEMKSLRHDLKIVTAVYYRNGKIIHTRCKNTQAAKEELLDKTAVGILLTYRKCSSLLQTTTSNWYCYRRRWLGKQKEPFLPKEITSLSDVRAFVKAMLLEGTNFHPDTPFDDYYDYGCLVEAKSYNKREVARRNALNEACFNLCKRLNVDYYEIGLRLLLQYT